MDPRKADEGELHYKKVGAKANPADLFTKNLGKEEKDKFTEYKNCDFDEFRDHFLMKLVAKTGLMRGTEGDHDYYS